MVNTDDFEYITDEDDIVHTSALKELSNDLITEGLKSEVDNPYMSHVDFLEQFEEEYEFQMVDLDEADDIYQDNKDIARDFYLRVLFMLDDRFHLEIDEEQVGAISLEGLKNMTEGLYTFFILKYRKNISKYLIRLIIDNEDSLADALNQSAKEMLKQKNYDDTVTYSSWTRKVENVRYGSILASVNEVIATVKNIDVDPKDFIEFFNTEKFEVACVEYAIDHMIITGDFVPYFLDVVFGDEVQNDIYDDIVGEVQHTLFKRYKKKTPLDIDILEPEETNDEDSEEEEN